MKLVAGLEVLVIIICLELALLKAEDKDEEEMFTVSSLLEEEQHDEHNHMTRHSAYTFEENCEDFVNRTNPTSLEEEKILSDTEKTCTKIASNKKVTRVAYLNMTDPTHPCPKNWTLISSPKRTCGRTSSEGDSSSCSSALFDTSILEGEDYSHVCGSVIGYQYCNTLAFWPYHHEVALTIDDPFLDGVTISYGDGEGGREHIWSFASALFEGYRGRDAVCPCTNTDIYNVNRVAKIPYWVKGEYFCETGANERVPPSSSKNCTEETFYADDPLWDGKGCNWDSSCCELNVPPHFYKKLTHPSSEDIEVRICGSGYTSFGDTPVELVEIYVW